MVERVWKTTGWTEGSKRMLESDGINKRWDDLRTSDRGTGEDLWKRKADLKRCNLLWDKMKAENLSKIGGEKKEERRSRITPDAFLEWTWSLCRSSWPPSPPTTSWTEWHPHRTSTVGPGQTNSLSVPRRGMSPGHTVLLEVLFFPAHSGFWISSPWRRVQGRVILGQEGQGSVLGLYK